MPVVMYGVFWISQTDLGPLIADWLVGCIETFQGWVVRNPRRGRMQRAFLQALLADGISRRRGRGSRFPAAGNGNVLPDRSAGGLRLYGPCYAWCMDPIFKRVGLSGKSVIPFVIGTGCGDPGHHGLPYDPG